MNEFTSDERLGALEDQVRLLVTGLNAISNDKVPRITLTKLAGVTITDESIDDDTISDVEAALNDAQRFSEKAVQDTRRLESSVRVLRFVVSRLLEAASSIDAKEVLLDAEKWIDGAGSGLIRSAPGLEERAAHKEIDEIRKLVSSIE